MNDWIWKFSIDVDEGKAYAILYSTDRDSLEIMSKEYRWMSYKVRNIHEDLLSLAVL